MAQDVFLEEAVRRLKGDDVEDSWELAELIRPKLVPEDEVEEGKARVVRPTADDCAMECAQIWARRGTCLKKQVGVVILDWWDRIISVGYNGAPGGFAHCLDEGCLLDELGDCIRSVHAEINAILNSPEKITNGRMFTTHFPCPNCMNAIITAEVDQVIYLHDRPDDLKRQRVLEMADEADIPVMLFGEHYVTDDEDEE